MSNIVYIYPPICSFLKTSSFQLNCIVKYYLIQVAQLDKMQIGKFSYKDIYDDFIYSLREYSITHSEVMQPWENPSSRKLLKLNKIPFTALRELIQNINIYLKKDTDYLLRPEKKREVLEQQIVEFIYTIKHTDDKSSSYMNSIIYDEDSMQLKKYKYLNTIINAMLQAEVNQYDAMTKKYLVVDKLLKIYSGYLNYMDKYQFKEKLKYLKKLELDKREKTLKKYVKQMIEEDENIEHIRWFFTYLVYSINKIHIYIVHSILGYKYKGAVKLYQKLFCKDHSTGRDEEFIRDYDFSHLTKKNLINSDEFIGTLVSDVELQKANKKLKKHNMILCDNKIYDITHRYEKQIYKDIAIQLEN